MVPHRRILQAIALVGLARADGNKHVAALLTALDVKFPGEWRDFAILEVQRRIPEALEALFITTDVASTLDYRPLRLAAEILKIPDIVTIDATGPTVILPPGLKRFRDHPSVRTMVESAQLCEIDSAMLCADLRQMYGMTVDESDLCRYGELFSDREYLEGESWVQYMRCIGEKEALFRRTLLGQPKDFVRWRLGVPVSLNADTVLNRMMSDAYYTERLIKSQAGNLGLTLTKEELTRVKLERDTVFKSMEMRAKMHEATGGDTATSAIAMLRGIVTKYESQDSLPTIQELEAKSGG